MNSLLPKAISLLIAIMISGSGYAQHSVEVERQAQAGEWMAALAAYKKMPSRKITSSTALAAAKSAWAMGLVDLAKAEYDRAIVLDRNEPTLSDDAKVRIYFARGVIELQEGKYQRAIAFAEKAFMLVESSPLRGEIGQLWGESLLKLNKPEAAIRKFETALNEVSEENLGELHYNIAAACMSVGELEKAEKHFTSIPLTHPKTGLAVKALASIAMENRKYKDALFWLKKGRADYAELFLDSWVDYALVKASTVLGQIPQAEQMANDANEKYPPSDGWLILMQSTLEQARWDQYEAKMARLKPATSNRGAHGKQ
jgi:tetratricopeptide (TPR) repeat protein